MQDRRNGKIFRDEEQSVPYYVTGNTWVGYDDIYSVINKVSIFLHRAPIFMYMYFNYMVMILFINLLLQLRGVIKRKHNRKTR